eukprot:XP_001691325.1 predicted protein [Chlamydomonas reinhardtii]
MEESYAPPSKKLRQRIEQMAKLGGLDSSPVQLGALASLVAVEGSPELLADLPVTRCVPFEEPQCAQALAAVPISSWLNQGCHASVVCLGLSNALHRDQAITAPGAVVTAPSAGLELLLGLQRPSVLREALQSAFHSRPMTDSEGMMQPLGAAEEEPLLDADAMAAAAAAVARGAPLVVESFEQACAALHAAFSRSGLWQLRDWAAQGEAEARAATVAPEADGARSSLQQQASEQAAGPHYITLDLVFTSLGACCYRGGVGSTGSALPSGLASERLGLGCGCELVAELVARQTDDTGVPQPLQSARRSELCRRLAPLLCANVAPHLMAVLPGEALDAGSPAQGKQHEDATELLRAAVRLITAAETIQHDQHQPQQPQQATAATSGIFVGGLAKLQKRLEALQRARLAREGGQEGGAGVGTGGGAGHGEACGLGAAASAAATGQGIAALGVSGASSVVGLDLPGQIPAAGWAHVDALAETQPQPKDEAPPVRDAASSAAGSILRGAQSSESSRVRGDGSGGSGQSPSVVSAPGGMWQDTAAERANSQAGANTATAAAKEAETARLHAVAEARAAAAAAQARSQAQAEAEAAAAAERLSQLRSQFDRLYFGMVPEGLRRGEAPLQQQAELQPERPGLGAQQAAPLEQPRGSDLGGGAAPLESGHLQSNLQLPPRERPAAGPAHHNQLASAGMHLRPVDQFQDGAPTAGLTGARSGRVAVHLLRMPGPTPGLSDASAGKVESLGLAAVCGQQRGHSGGAGRAGRPAAVGDGVADAGTGSYAAQYLQHTSMSAQSRWSASYARQQPSDAAGRCAEAWPQESSVLEFGHAAAAELSQGYGPGAGAIDPEADELAAGADAAAATGRLNDQEGARPHRGAGSWEWGEGGDDSDERGQQPRSEEGWEELAEEPHDPSMSDHDQQGQRQQVLQRQYADEPGHQPAAQDTGGAGDSDGGSHVGGSYEDGGGGSGKGGSDQDTESISLVRRSAHRHSEEDVIERLWPTGGDDDRDGAWGAASHSCSRSLGSRQGRSSEGSRGSARSGGAGGGSQAHSHSRTHTSAAGASASGGSGGGVYDYEDEVTRSGGGGEEAYSHIRSQGNGRPRCMSSGWRARKDPQAAAKAARAAGEAAAEASAAALQALLATYEAHIRDLQKQVSDLRRELEAERGRTSAVLGERDAAHRDRIRLELENQVLLAQQVELRRMCEAYAALAERSNNYMRMAVALPEAVSAAPQQLMLGQLPP